MPHADATRFPSSLVTTRMGAYNELLDMLVTLVEDTRNWVANTANTASLLWHMYHSMSSPSNRVNWAGFYVLDPSNNEQLVLGPFMGKVACQTIKMGKGVCGTAAAKATPLVVRDVDDFEGHIACDGETRSEIVVPVVVMGRVVAVIDVDCTEVGGFNDDDRLGLEAVAELLASSCDW